jgi:hypothetical protein
MSDEELERARRSMYQSIGAALVGATGSFAAAVAAVAAECTPVAQAPHAFVGRRDRWCQVCNRPDRHPVHHAPRS